MVAAALKIHLKYSVNGLKTRRKEMFTNPTQFFLTWLKPDRLSWCSGRPRLPDQTTREKELYTMTKGFPTGIRRRSRQLIAAVCAAVLVLALAPRSFAAGGWK